MIFRSGCRRFAREQSKRSRVDATSLIVFLFVSLFLLFSGACLHRYSYRPPASGEPSAILKLKFHDLNSLPGAAIHTAVILEGSQAGVLHEAIHEPILEDGVNLAVASDERGPSGEKGKIEEKPVVRLAMDAGRIGTGPVLLTIHMEARWEEERLEHLTYFDGNNWRQRLTRVSVQRKAGCRTELKMNIVEDTIYLLDYTWYSLEECQAIAYRQTFNSGGFALQEVARSSHFEPILDWPGSFRFGPEPWVWYPYRPAFDRSPP